MTSRKPRAQGRGRLTPEPNPSTPAASATTETTTSPGVRTTDLGEFFREFHKKAVALTVDAAFEQHRLSFTYDDDDTPDEYGRPTTLFVCRCHEGFDRSTYNRHIRDMYKEVI